MPLPHYRKDEGIGPGTQIYNFLKQVTCQPFERVQDIFLVYECHLAVDLGEFRLAVCPEVLVAETLDDLQVTVKSGHHQQLLECLRGLRQGVKLAVVHAWAPQNHVRLRGSI